MSKSEMRFLRREAINKGLHEGWNKNNSLRWAVRVYEIMVYGTTMNLYQKTVTK